MEVALDVPAVPIPEDVIAKFLEPREPREEITIEKVELTREMIQDQPPLPDPVFAPGDVVPCVYAAGAELSTLEAYDADFKEMIKEMFEMGSQLKLTKEGVDEQIAQYEESTAELTLPMVENE